MKPVLCIRNDPYDRLGITQSALNGNGMAMIGLDAFDPAAEWPALDAISALTVFGGAMNVDETEAHPSLLRERQLMQQALASGTPVLGICLGAQMLARALGAPVYPGQVRELGFTPVTLTAAGLNDPLMSELGMNPCVFQWHEDTFDLPAGATLLATGDRIANQAFRYGSRAWGVQFHFEVDREGIEEWLRVSEPSLESEWGMSVREVREGMDAHLDRQQAAAGRMFAAFCRQISG